MSWTSYFFDVAQAAKNSGENMTGSLQHLKFIIYFNQLFWFFRLEKLY